MRCAIRPAFTVPLNLVFLAIAAGLAASWWYFLLGLALYGWLVHLTARDPIVQVWECLRQRAPLAPRLETPFPTDLAPPPGRGVLRNATSRCRRHQTSRSAHVEPRESLWAKKHWS